MQNVCCDFLYSFDIFLILRRLQRYIIKKYIGLLHVKYRLFLSECNETWIFETDFRKIFSIRFPKYPSSGSRVVPCGQTDGQT
jgi:hypothetical protein